jgi:hypothetical protein
MADNSSASSTEYVTASASEIQTVRSSSQSPSAIYRKWASASASRATEKEQRRAKLFEVLEALVRNHGGCITTPPGERRIRIECPADSDLQAKLGNYNPIPIGQCMRTTYLGFQQMTVLEITLDELGK